MKQTSIIQFACLAVSVVGCVHAALADESLPTPADITFEAQDGASAPVPVERAGELALPRARLADVRTVPMFSVGVDFRQILSLKKLLVGRHGPNIADEFLMLELPGEEEWDTGNDTPVLFRFDSYITRPQINYFGDMVVPMSAEAAAEFHGESLKDNDIRKVDDGVFEVEDMLCVVADNHYAMRYSENVEHGEEDIAQLRAFMQKAASERSRHTGFISSTPSKIGRSVVKPELASVRARLSADMQRRDDQDEEAHLISSMWPRLQLALFDAFFSDTETIEYTIDFEEASRSLTISLDVKTSKGTPLDQYIGRLSQTRNRLVSYLHPDQTAFVSLNLPLSDDFAKAVPQVGNYLTAALFAEAGLSDSPASGVSEALKHIAEIKTAQCLIQAVPTEQDSTAVITIIPLEAATALQAPLVQLASGIQEAGVQNVGEVAGWPVCEFRQLDQTLGLSDVDGLSSYVVATEECVALMMGREDDLSVLEDVLKREFEASAAGGRFHRTAFAISTTLESFQFFDERVLGKSFFVSPADIESDTANNVPAKAGRVEMSLRTAPQQMTLVTTFDDPALRAGCAFVSLSIEGFMGIVEGLF